MVPYLSFYLLIGLFATLEPKTKSKRVKGFGVAVLFVTLLLILSFRHPSMGVDLGYGNDTGYLGRFDEIRSISWNTIFTTQLWGYEKGFLVFFKLISYVSNNYQWLLFCCSFISLFPIFMIYKKYSYCFGLSLILYMSFSCFLILFSGLRQGIAIGICFASFYFVKEKKLIPFIVLTIVAFLFHRTAILFLLAYPFFYIRIKNKFRLITLFLVALIFVFRIQIFNLFAPIFKSGVQAEDNGAVGLFLILVGLYLFCMLFCTRDNDETNGLMNLFLLAIVFQLFGSVYLVASRISFYFLPFLGLLLPTVFKQFSALDRSVIVPIFVIVFVGYSCFMIYNSETTWAQAYPWIPFWAQVK